MQNQAGDILYVGKAIQLKKRVLNYFQKGADDRYQIQFLMKRVQDIQTIVCNNEKEALLLESTLIKKHKPRYNIFLKDDKSYLHIKLSGHQFSRLMITRQIKKDKADYFGPYIDAEAARRTAELLQRHFKLRTCSDHELNNRSRPCLEYQIKRCSAPCCDLISKESYQADVQTVKYFLKGQNKKLVQALKQKMEQQSQALDFEEAAKTRDLIEDIKKTLVQQQVYQHHQKNQDAIGFYRDPENQKGSFTVLLYREGKLVDSQNYLLPLIGEDSECFESFLNQYYRLAHFFPNEVLVPKQYQPSEHLIGLVGQRAGFKVDFLMPQKGDKKKLTDLAHRNAHEFYLQKIKKEHDLNEVLERLREKLHLINLPETIECFDVSNISGVHATASKVRFEAGKPNKKLYRHFKIKDIEGPNDYLMLKQVLFRRLEKKDCEPLPDLLMVDGGRSHLNMVAKIFDEQKIKIDLAGIAKGQGQGVRAKGVWQEKKEDEIYLVGRKNPVIFKAGSAELMLLQRVRDEAHRFAISYHRKLRQKTNLVSVLDTIKGVGPKTRKKLFEFLPDIQKIIDYDLSKLSDQTKIKEELLVKIREAILENISS